MMMAQRIMLALSKTMDRHPAGNHVRAAAHRAITSDISFKQALLDDEVLAPHFDHLDQWLNPETYLGLSAKQVDLTIQSLKKTPYVSGILTETADLYWATKVNKSLKPCVASMVALTFKHLWSSSAT